MITLQSMHRVALVLGSVAAFGAQTIATPAVWADDVPSPLQAEGAPHPDFPHHAPPPEAFTACSGHAAGDVCTVIHDGHEMQGTCAASPDHGLFCHHHHGPPPEAFEACSGHAAGAACSVSFHGGASVAGTCDAGPDGRIACRPANMPPHP